MEHTIKRISTAGIDEAISKAERFVAIFWRSSRSISSQRAYLGLPLRISSPAVGPIVTVKPKRSSGNSTILMSGSTTLGFCTSDARKRSSKPDNFLVRCQRSSNMLCALSRRRRKFVRRETTMLSCAGIAACGCFKIQPTNGTKLNRNSLPSMRTTPRQDSKSPSGGRACTGSCTTWAKAQCLLTLFGTTEVVP